MLGPCNDFGADFPDKANLLIFVDHDLTVFLVKALFQERVYLSQAMNCIGVLKSCKF